MSRFMAMAGDKAHERTITMATYPVGDDKVVVEGRLVDRRLREYYLATGEKKPAGDIHNLIVRLLVENRSLTIEDVEVELIAVPRDECQAVTGSLDAIKGERITRGFTGRMKSLLGGIRSCTHLMTLVIAMGPAALQGIFSSRAQKPMEMASFLADPGRAEFFMKTLNNTCYVWREDGPAMTKLRETIKAAGGA